jgi:hypothetical protein
MTNTAQTLPALPKPRTLSRGDEDGAIQLGYTADQMHAYARAAIAAQPAPDAPAVAWHVHIRGCDGSADWVELGAAAPADIPQNAEALPLVYAKLAQPVPDAAPEPTILQPLETIRYWLDAYSNPASVRTALKGHGMMAALVREYLAVREIAAAHPQQPAPGPDDSDAEELRALNDKLAGILSRTAVALRGPEPPLTRWSWHDLPERAAAAIACIDMLQRVAGNLAADGITATPAPTTDKGLP